MRSISKLAVIASGEFPSQSALVLRKPTRDRRPFAFGENIVQGIDGFHCIEMHLIEVASVPDDIVLHLQRENEVICYMLSKLPVYFTRFYFPRKVCYSEPHEKLHQPLRWFVEPDATAEANSFCLAQTPYSPCR